ncbi:MAG: condensation domain-containing protein, partial [Cyanobacteria bacterium P01_C01_bin.72]
MGTETLQGFQLSPQQKHLWLLQQESKIRLSQAVIKIQGKVDLIALQAAMQKIVDRQEILRTNFYRRPGVSIPFQVVRENRKVVWQSIELNDLSQSEVESRILEQLYLEKSAKFSLEHDLLLRLKLLNLNQSCHYLIITLPALCADSQTMNNLAQELSLSYSYCLQQQDFLEDPVQYTQFSEWQNELLTESSEAGLDYWQQQQLEHSDLILPSELKYDINSEINLNRHCFKIQNNLTNKINLLATKYNSSLSNFLLSCWYILIYKLTNITQIRIANLFTARDYEELA